MVIKNLVIENWKSIVRIELKDPNPFSVFVGSNASGKSNIFEALEYFTLAGHSGPNAAISFFGNEENIINRKAIAGLENNGNSNVCFVNLEVEFENSPRSLLSQPFKVNSDGKIQKEISSYELLGEYSESIAKEKLVKENINPPSKIYKAFSHPDFIQFFKNFSKIFIIPKIAAGRVNIVNDAILSSSAENVEYVLKIILKDKTKREEIIEWLQLLIPGFENVEIKSSELSGNAELAIYEKGTRKPFQKNLISDGTYNILCLLTAVFQSDQPQFLLIEEPENGINPKVVRELVNLFRSKCEEEGHFIWLNTHSQTLVNQLTEKEVIIVDKIDGETQVKQIEEGKAYGLPMDEALLTNTFRGGIPW